MQTRLLYILSFLFFSLSVNAQVLFFEDFETAEGATPPNGWTQEVLSGAAHKVWRFDDPGEEYSPIATSEVEGKFAIFDSRYYAANAPDDADEDVVLTSPVLDFSAEENYIFLIFQHHVNTGFNSDPEIIVEVYDGEKWVEIYRREGNSINTIRLEITEHVKGINNAQFRFRFQGEANNKSYWMVDNVEVRSNIGLDIRLLDIEPRESLECWSQGVTLFARILNSGHIPIDFSEHPLQLRAGFTYYESLYENIITEGILEVGEEGIFAVTTDAQFPEFGKSIIFVKTEVDGEFNPSNNARWKEINRWGPNHSPTHNVFGEPNSNNSTNTIENFSWRPAFGSPDNLVIDTDSEEGWKRASYFVNDPNHEYKLGSVLQMGDAPVNVWRLSRPIFVTEVSHLIFETAMTQTGSMESGTWGSDDFLAILVSTDCGKSFEEIRRFDKNTPIDNQTRRSLIKLRDYADQEIQIGLYASNGTEDDGTDVELFLANLSIQEIPVWDTALGEVDVEAIYCNEVDGNVWVEVLNSGSGSLPLALNPLHLNLTVILGSKEQHFNVVIDEGTLTANHSTWMPIPLLDYQTLSNFECWIGLNVFLEEEQNESNNIQEWYQPLRNPFFGHTLSVDFQGHYNHLPLGNTFPGWWEGEGIEKPIESNSRWETENTGGGLISVDFEEGEEIEEWIVSPVFVPENNTELRFNFFINSWPEQNLGNDDVFEIMISTDCMNFEPLKVYDSAYVHPIGRVEDVYDLSAYEGEEVMIAFHGSSNGIADKYAILVLYDVYIGPALDTGIADNSLEEEGSLRVFPNPSEGVFYLDWEEKMQIEEEGEIIVTNAMGQIIYQATLSSILTNSSNGKQYIVDANDWEDGVYLLLWRYANQSYSQKLVKMAE